MERVKISNRTKDNLESLIVGQRELGDQVNVELISSQPPSHVRGFTSSFYGLKDVLK